MMQSDSTLSVKDATGRHISLLNDQQQQQQQQQQYSTSPVINSALHGKRKYHCTESGCHKSFTTSGHLARHYRIHTGEKNYFCLHPGCPSRFSRQDNMMQHYRTHLAPKSRRQQHQQLHQRSKGTTINSEYPRLHGHTMVGSEEHSVMHPLINTQAVAADSDDSIVAVTTRSRRATTLPSSFYPYPSSSTMDYFYTGARHHHHQQLPTMVQPLEKPLPMEPDSEPSPSSTIITSPTMMSSSVATSPDAYHHPHSSYQVSRRPQRAYSSSSTCSSTSSSSFLSPRPMSQSPSPPLVDPTDIIYPKQFIQLPPPHQPKDQNYSIVSHGHHRQGLLDLAHAVSIFG